jgi:hypothetical protein
MSEPIITVCDLSQLLRSIKKPLLYLYNNSVLSLRSHTALEQYLNIRTELYLVTFSSRLCFIELQALRSSTNYSYSSD